MEGAANQRMGLCVLASVQGAGDLTSKMKRFTQAPR